MVATNLPLKSLFSLLFQFLVHSCPHKYFVLCAAVYFYSLYTFHHVKIVSLRPWRHPLHFQQHILIAGVEFILAFRPRIIFFVWLILASMFLSHIWLNVFYQVLKKLGVILVPENNSLRGCRVDRWSIIR